MEYVLHQAAIPSVPRSVSRSDDIAPGERRRGTECPGRLREAGVKRLVYAGSSAAYGNAPTLPKREDMPPNPLSPYALQKLVAEQYCQMFTLLYGFETVTIRYFNVFGPRQDPGSPYSGVISLFATALLEGRPPTIYGDGEQTRDFTYVANVVDGVLRACDAPKAAGEVINVATGGRISLNELLRVMSGFVGARVAPILQRGTGGRREGLAGGHHQGENVARLRADRRAREGLRRTIEWCRAEQTSPAPPVGGRSESGR
jgi:nucleoside-diphosphate-sugar epimerase